MLEKILYLNTFSFCLLKFKGVFVGGMLAVTTQKSLRYLSQASTSRI